ncbi:MAG: hypothetical protein GY816_12990 [Cytophagales bacterium]|nr:hypothetical protein [Cytophagales bacterium]
MAQSDCAVEVAQQIDSSDSSESETSFGFDDDQQLDYLQDEVGVASQNESGSDDECDDEVEEDFWDDNYFGKQTPEKTSTPPTKSKSPIIIELNGYNC